MSEHCSYNDQAQHSYFNCCK